DASGGNGILPKSWKEPIKGFECGYSGGLNPSNITEQLFIIGNVVKDGIFNIDMESGLKTNLWFDQKKARSILRDVEQYNKMQKGEDGFLELFEVQDRS